MSEPLTEETGRAILEQQKHTNRLLEALVTHQGTDARKVLASLNSKAGESKVDQQKKGAMAEARQRAAKNGFPGVAVKEGVHAVARSKEGH